MSEPSEQIVHSILIVDDNAVVRQTLKICLQSLGVQNLYEAEHGEHAKQLIEEHDFAAIICDLNMPVSDGLEVLFYLNSIRYKGHVVLISGEEREILISTFDLAGLYQLNILGCIEKPVSAASLNEILLGPLKSQPRKKSENQTNRRLIFHNDLQRLLGQDCLEPFFQPQICNKTGKVHGIEVLARILDGDVVISPDQFIQVAESDVNMIKTLTEKLIKKTLVYLSKDLDFFKNFYIAFNISASVLGSRNFPYWLDKVVKQHGFDPQKIVSELTETAVVEDNLLIHTQLLRLRMMGFVVSIDDFGTGYSSLSQIHALPFNELKIDKSFVMDCLNNRKSRAVLEQSIRLAKALNISVVAEGVETQEIANLLTKLECDFNQGFLYSKPLPYQALLDYLNENKVV